MCDGQGDPCDSLCGGAGCGKCGGLSCDDGAVTKAANALSVAQDAAKILEDREREVDELLRSVSTEYWPARSQMTRWGASVSQLGLQSGLVRSSELLAIIFSSYMHHYKYLRSFYPPFLIFTPSSRRFSICLFVSFCGTG